MQRISKWQLKINDWMKDILLFKLCAFHTPAITLLALKEASHWAGERRFRIGTVRVMSWRVI